MNIDRASLPISLAARPFPACTPSIVHGSSGGGLSSAINSFLRTFVRILGPVAALQQGVEAAHAPDKLPFGPCPNEFGPTSRVAQGLAEDGFDHVLVGTQHARGTQAVRDIADVVWGSTNITWMPAASSPPSSGRGPT
ncbi:hypothetical protein [Ramlibacter sp.]|uniref:hypothetical protein n=1 Tax=Ramlibacter sp. TaxID=1917967 RepID=UPI003D0D0D3E